MADVTTCARCGKPGAVAYPDLWIDLHPPCAVEWWEQVEAERTRGLSLRPPEQTPNDDDPALLRSRGVF